MLNEQKNISLTGIKPTSQAHLGNYLGAIKPAIELSRTGLYDCFYFIADYHALTKTHRAQDFRQNVYDVSATWIAAGLDFERNYLYRQSDIPEILEISWILSCFTSKGLMNRAHAYKSIAQDNEKAGRDEDEGINIGLFTYPVLMASDILSFGANLVPVGADQVQHIEIARDIAQAFNSNYKKEILIKPEAKINQSIGLVPGLDGRKMSSSYNNFIPLFTTEKKLKKIIGRITTDSTPAQEPKDPKDSIIFELYQHIASKDELASLSGKYLSGISWGEAKAILFEKLNSLLSAPRERYTHLMENPSKVEEILQLGKEKVRPKAQETLSKLKETIGSF